MGSDLECDAALIEASLDDPAVFGEIYDRHAPALLSYIVRRVGRVDAEELLGDLFRTAFELRARFETDRTSCLPWLYGIAANLVMKHYRSNARQKAAYARASLTRPAPTSFEEGFVDADASASLAQRVIDVVEALPERDREVVYLYAWQDLSYSEIAEALGIPTGTVRSRLNRARKTLRELDDRFGEVPDGPPTPTDEGSAR